MKHRKSEHNSQVKTCIKYEKNICLFGAEACGFQQPSKNFNIEEQQNDENPEIIERIFDMMEKFTEIFEFIENQL